MDTTSLPTAASLPDSPERSPKSYGTAVALSATFGFLGVQHFYLGRFLLGMLDAGLSIGGLLAFAWGHPLVGASLWVLDAGHALQVTVQLLTGGFRDGDGRIVCYPGQRLGPRFENQDMRRTAP